MLQQRRQLRVDEAGHVLEMIRLVRLEEEQGRRAVRRVAELGEEEGVAGGDDPVGHEETRVAVIGMQAVPLPRVVAEDDVRLQPADAGGDLEALAESRLELAVGPAEEDDLALAAERHRGGSLLAAPRHDELGRVLCGVPGSLGPVGAHEVEDLAAA